MELSTTSSRMSSLALLAALSAGCSGESVVDGASSSPNAAIVEGTGAEQPGALAATVGSTPVVTQTSPGVAVGPQTIAPAQTSVPVTGVSCSATAPRRVRRLSQREYFNVVSDLLGPKAVEATGNALPFEPKSAGFDNQDNSLRVSAAFHSALSQLAEALASQADVESLAPCQSAEAECLNDFARAFSRKAYGRNATDEELSRLLKASESAANYDTRVRLVVEIVLQSPNTLYATELGQDNAAPGALTVELTQHERATQLSLLLTGARPDEQLLDAADAGRLATPDGIALEAERLMKTDRAKAQMRLFVNGWLNQGSVADAPKTTKAFPEFTPVLAAAMEAQTNAFIDEQIAGDGTLSALLTANPREIPEALVPIYGDDLTPTGLDPSRRGGVLSLPGVLTYHSADQHSGPIERGLLVRNQLLCTQVPAPPPDVMNLLAQDPIDPEDPTLTTRDKYAIHAEIPSCAACHSLIDPIGFGFEEMDGLGRYRTTENDLAVDSSGKLAGTDVDGAFEGVAELGSMLARSKDVQACFVEHFFRFASSRAAEANESCQLNAWGTRFSESDGYIPGLFMDFVSDPNFVKRMEDRL